MQGLAWRQACHTRPLPGSRQARPLHGSQAQIPKLLELLLELLPELLLLLLLLLMISTGARSAPLELRNKYIQQKQQQQFQQQLQQHQHLCLTAMQGSCMAGLIVNQAPCKAAYSLMAV